MTGRDFCFWLQGFFKLRGEAAAPISAGQAACIQKHLALVFVHEIDPSAGGREHQAKLNEVHNPQTAGGVHLSAEDVKKLVDDAVKTAPAKPHSHPYDGPPVFRC